MSNNISVNNLAIGGTSAFTGTVSLASPLISGSTCSVQGLSTTDLKTTGVVIHDVLPICNVIPVEANELSNKGYIDSKNNLQDIRLTNIDTLNVAQNNRLTGVELRNTTQDGRLSTIETLNGVQNNRLTSVELKNTNQDERLDIIDSLNEVQDGRLLDIENTDTVQTTRLDEIDILNGLQNTRLTGIDTINTTQNTRLTNIDTLNVTQNDRLTAAEGVNTNQNTRLTGIDTLNVTQDGRILAVEDKTTNLSFLNNRTTLNGVSTVVGIMNFTVPPVSATLPTGATQLSNKQYIDNNVQIINNSILVANNSVTALTTRVATVETKSTNVSYAAGSNTTSISGVVSFLNAPTIAATSTATNSIQTKAYIDTRDQLLSTSITNLETRATTIEGVNTTQGTSITAIQAVNTTQGTNITTLQQKTTPIVYTTPVTGNLTELTSSLSLLPNTSATVLRAYSVICTAINCAVQATFGGTGANQGITTSQLTVGGFGTTFKTVYFGSVTSVVGTNLVTFATALTGAFPKVFIQAISGTVLLTNKTLAGFVFTATTVVNVDYFVVQGL